MDAAAARFQKETTKIFEDIDKDVIRKIQLDMFKCSAKCCENESASTQEIERCLQSCSQPLDKAQTFIQSETENFQNRISRCTMDCQDAVRDKVRANMSLTEQKALEKDIEPCVIKCADSGLSKLPEMRKRIVDMLRKNVL